MDYFPLIAVPARNEEQRLCRLIETLAAQSWLADRAEPMPVTLVLNNCTDQSYAVAAATARRFPQLLLGIVQVIFPPEKAHVGSARRLALDRAVLRCAAPDAAVLLTTDADAELPPDWVAENIAAIRQGADLVGGKIVGDPGEEQRLGLGFVRRAQLYCAYADLGDRLTTLLDPIEHDPWPRHHDHTGASLAIRGSVYRDLGGMPALPVREDLAFVSSARAAGYRLRHAPEVSVKVSARLDGRAPGGMATCIRSWMQDEAEGRPILVEAPSRIAARARRRAVLRRLSSDRPESYAAAAEALRVPGERLLDHAGSFLSATLLIEQFAPDEPDAQGTIQVEEALVEIRSMIDRLEDVSVAA